jgi:cobyrinic acid a,c-diamide synthase
MILGPRLVVAGTGSGVGKTTVASGLMAAFARRGTSTAGAKVGPDYIDPGYHALATGRAPRNLDPWLCGIDAIGPLAGRASAGADLLVVEGVMGLFDGAADGAPSSTADVAAQIDAPIVLVIEASGIGRSVAAMVLGFATFDPRVRIEGIIANRVGSPRHVDVLRDGLEPLGIPLLGALARDDAFEWRDRHLGLVPVVERPDAVRRALDRVAAAIERTCDLDALARIAAGAPPLTVADPPLPDPVGEARLAVAAGPAFSFAYTDNLDALTAAGAEILPFDPCEDTSLPEHCDALIAGGGFPEVYADSLSENRPLLADVRRRADEGLVIWAECGGLLWLSASLDGRPLAGVVPAHASMTPRLTLGYRRAHARVDSPLGPAGMELRGHEFHYSSVRPTGDGLAPLSTAESAPAAWLTPRMFASYLHVHLGATPEIARSVVRCAAAR